MILMLPEKLFVCQTFKLYLRSLKTLCSQNQLFLREVICVLQITNYNHTTSRSLKEYKEIKHVNWHYSLKDIRQNQ